MSRIWSAASAADIATVPTAGAGQGGGVFRSLYSAPSVTTMTLVAEPHFEEEQDPLEQARIEAFTMGFEEGGRIAAEAAESDIAVRTRLAEALEMLTPAPSGMLSTMLSATVVRLVEQIVGEVEIDIDRLVERCDTVAAFIEDGEKKGALYLHPDDLPLIEGHDVAVKLVADPAMHRGCVRLETSDGWVEDGPDVRLSRLRALLDGMEGRP
ncbi:MAG: FliH/SctL family protein [Sphingobium sp.]